MTPSLFENLRSRQTEFVLVSRAPYARIVTASAERGWDVPWYSSFGSDFNIDFEVTVDETNPLAARYNYRPEPGLARDGASELPGLSCFLREADGIFHTYSTYARGTEYIGNSYTLLDLTALGRQEAWEEPKDRNQSSRDGDPSFTS